MSVQTDHTIIDVYSSVGGAPTAVDPDLVFRRLNPFTGEVVTTVAGASPEDAQRAVDVAAAAYPAWSATTATHRRTVLLRAADLLSERAVELSQVMTAEIGATPVQAQFNIDNALGYLREAASLTTLASGHTLPANTPGAFSITIRKPLGVCVAIAPWNGPVMLVARALAYPLAFGNTVVFKTSEQSPRCHALVAQILEEAGLTPGVLNVVHHRPEDGADITRTLIEHPAVRHVNFTGSSRVGRIIGETAARTLTRSLLELGGKAPFVVLEDADLDEAAKAAAFGAFFAQGQACMSTERVIVVDSVADDLVDRMVRHAGVMRAGDPSDHIIGPMVSERAAVGVEQMVDEAVAKGAVARTDPAREGAVLQPTIVDRVTPEMTIYREEIFGPATVIIRVADEDEAVAVANSSDYGLSSSIYSRDVTRALHLATRLEVGMCHINGSTLQDEPQAPFGGVKASGWGYFGGTQVIDEFTTLQWVTIDDVPGRYPPYLG